MERIADMKPNELAEECRFSNDHVRKNEAKHLLRVGPDNPHLLVLPGICNTEFLSDLLALIYICDRLNSDISLFCAGNASLATWNRLKFENVEKIHINENAADLPLLMDSADLMLSEPDPCTASDAVSRHLPLIFSHNERNALPPVCMDLIGRNCAVLGSDDEVELAELRLSLLTQETKRKQMERAFQSISTSNDAERGSVIYDRRR